MNKIIRKIYYRTYELWTPLRVIRNVILTWRYPWLAVHDWRNNKIRRTSIWATPRDGGWNRAFFWQMMEEIRKAAKESGTLKTLRTEDYKSKYGGLRFYVSGATSKVSDIIHQYECMSQFICESCGEPDVGATQGWITPICRTCYAKSYGNTRSYDECVGEDRIPDYYRYRVWNPDKDEPEEFAIDIKDKANKIRKRWNFWHPNRKKTYSEDK